MLDAPRQDWAWYEARAAASDSAWLRGLTAWERFQLYADLFQLVREGRDKRGDWARLEQWQWEQKLALRLKMVETYAQRDRIVAERAAASHPD